MSVDPQNKHFGQVKAPLWRVILRVALRVLLAHLFVAIGVLHFVRPGFFEQIVPPYLPQPLALVYISGYFEILGGCCIMIPAVRLAAGWGLIALLIAVFPANLHMALNDVHVDGKAASPLLLWLRLPLQLVFIVWVWWCARDDSLRDGRAPVLPGAHESEQAVASPSGIRSSRP
jgi:uncharacterized membrane protein